MMSGSSIGGALVPSVKADAKSSSATATEAAVEAEAEADTAEMDEVGSGSGGGGGGFAETDKDLLCPICMQIIKDAFLTICGHNFCYMCIITHLNNKNDCPCCGNYLTSNQLFPNFLLSKLLKKTSARQIAKTASPAEHLRQALQQGYQVSLKELDSLLSFLTEKKRKMEQEEAETNMMILLDFLHCLRKQKLEELNEIQNDLLYIKEDISSVERHRMELYRTRGLTLHISAILPRDHFLPISSPFILNRPMFSRFTGTPIRKALFQARNQELLLEKQPFDVKNETEEEQTSSSEDSSLLSLNLKPDRNMALLDDYELEEISADCNSTHRSGYVAVLGRPNVGKSTLSNQMIGQKLSIVTDKPQTTRHRILGICSCPEYQIILYDTPGVMEKEMHKLDSMMMKNVRSATINADCVLVVVDACRMPEKIDQLLEEGVGSIRDKVPILLVLNKKDLIKPGEVAKRLQWYEKFTNVDEVIPVSAKYGHGVDDIKEWIVSKLPLGPAFYSKEIVSEHPERFFVGEIVREKIFMQYRNEVPYACQVNVLNYIARPTSKDFIQVEVVVERNSQKIILIGKDGKALKILATAARLDIEDFLQKKVYLEIEVKVKENWRQDEGLLKYYGYSGQIQSLVK